MAGTSARVSASGLQWLTSKASRAASSSPTVHCAPPTPPPALLISTSTVPSAASAWSARSAAAPRRARSATATWGRGRPPAAISSASERSRSSLRAVTTSRAPRPASVRASSRPMPVEAPVSSTLRSVSGNLAIVGPPVESLTSLVERLPRVRPVRHTAPVARTRTELHREAKVAEILDAAERRLRSDGYRALSVVGIARELGLAQNALYWYFPTKEHLFVATLEQMLRGIVARKPPRQGGVERQVEWFVDQLAELEPVRAAMHERARSSAVVAQFAAELDATWHRMLTNVLGDRLRAKDRDLAVDTLLATISGVLSQRLPAARRRQIVGLALERLTPSARSVKRR